MSKQPNEVEVKVAKTVTANENASITLTRKIEKKKTRTGWVASDVIAGCSRIKCI